LRVKYTKLSKTTSTYLIDGHNLIPKVSGLSLESLDDENELIALLQVFCRIKRKAVEVFFDKAPPGTSGVRNSGMVKVHYVRQGTQADDVIISHLRSSGKSARNKTVVTSDRRVISEARALQAELMSSEEFAAELCAANSAQIEEKKNRGTEMNDAELKEWMEIFSVNRKKPD
jgi:uncharacterized protein